MGLHDSSVSSDVGKADDGMVLEVDGLIDIDQ
jgi:hypothetical protein